MANIMDYMDWRGDLSFEADEFNEVDNLILAQLAYVDFEGIVTAEENAPAVPLKEASGQFWEKNDKDEILARVSMTKSAPFVMEKMAETKRFSDVKLRCYVNEIRDEEQFQFSAVCVELPDDSLYVAFRGTDNTITGWREDFNGLSVRNAGTAPGSGIFEPCSDRQKAEGACRRPFKGWKFCRVCLRKM